MQKNIVATKGERLWQGIPGIEVSKNGRRWACLYSGGEREPRPENYVLITTSEDGIQWSDPEIILEGDATTRIYDPTLWIDPIGRLWLIANHSSIEKQEFYVEVRIATNPDAANPNWGWPMKIDLGVAFAFRMNKLIVTSTGEWMLPVTWSNRAPKKKWFTRPAKQGVGISIDQGKTWTLHGKVKVRGTGWALESMLIERDKTKNPNLNRFWMLVRAGKGWLYESHSEDGRKWSRSKKSNISGPGSRFFIGRLQSGRMLLINNMTNYDRTGMYVALSEDEGLTFPYRLVIDPRANVSYPDAIQTADGVIHIVYDRERYGPGEVNYIQLSEEEILKS